MEPWKALGISRAWYFRQLKVQPHASLLPQYIEFRRQGLTEKPWSTNFERLCQYQLRKYFEAYPLVTYGGIRSWLVGTYSQKKDRHTALSGFARFLVFIGLMEGEDLPRIKALSPKRSPYAHVCHRIVSKAEVEVLCSVSPVCLFLSETALRISEFSNLRPEHLHHSQEPTQAYIEVICGKGGKSRTIPFSKRAQECQIDHGKSRYWWGKHIRQIAIHTGIDFSAHSLRHYRITRWANDARIPLAVTMKWAGHSDLVTTQRYIHITDEDAMKAAYEMD